MKKRALISVSDKTGVIEFAKNLIGLGYEIISTGGTAKALTDAKIPNIGISEITNFPECLDGRVKTLHPAVHAGLLAMRSNPEHMEQLNKLNINTIDIVAVNLYPFKATIMKDNVEFADAVENIDIGGPTMLRSAAKNYQDVLVVVEPSDYVTVIDKLKSGEVDLNYRKMLMYKVYQHTAVYDTMISTYLKRELDLQFPEHFTIAFDKTQDLRYGENPHQDAAFYSEVLPVKGSLCNAVQLNGKELSYNNINDANGALDLIREFSEPAAVAVKHANPCGVAVAEDIYTAYLRAYECDPVSIFGGIVALNRTVDAKTAEEMSKIFLEIIIAPDYEPSALEILKKKANLRVLKLNDILAQPDKFNFDMKKINGGLLVQQRDRTLYDQIEVVTKRKPTDKELEQLMFAYKVVKHSKSNAIALAKDYAAIGVGSGQTNRIWATEQAIDHAGSKVEGAVLASDAYFPFDDCVTAAAKAGITAIVQPGGSKRDGDSIKKCDEHNIAMIFVGYRHFKH